MTRLTAIIAAALLAAPLFAQAPAGRRGPHNPDALIAYLNLSDSQVTALQENNKALREAVKTIASGAREDRSGVRDELKQDNPNPTIIGQALVDAKETREAVKAKREEFRTNAMAILTPQQQTALAALQEALGLMPTAREAIGFNLLESPEGEMGPRGPGGPGGRMGGPEGFRGGPRPGGPR